MKPFWDKIAEMSIQGAYALGILAAFWVLSSIVLRVVNTVANRATDSRRDVILLGGQASKVTILIIGIISALGTAGVNVSALVASLGLTGFALGFAFKDVLSNLLAGAMILFYRPFRHGERITVTTFEGTVYSIDFRYTTLEDGGRKYLIPNSTMLLNVITVMRPPAND
ncbi:mechanosensitive ion channel [soil metagenome]